MRELRPPRSRLSIYLRVFAVTVIAHSLWGVPFCLLVPSCLRLALKTVEWVCLGFGLAASFWVLIAGVALLFLAYQGACMWILYRVLTPILPSIPRWLGIGRDQDASPLPD